jgi:nucleoside-diphosphate-sugar epimerase
MRIFITGGSGFIGGSLLELLVNSKNYISTISRFDYERLNSLDLVVRGDIGQLNKNNKLSTVVKGMLENTDVIIHLAGRAHIASDDSTNPLDEYRKINRDATLSLARIAANSGVKRFVFLSSIGVNGNQNNKPFTERDKPNPEEDYAISKYEAEQGLLNLSKEFDMEVVIIRPPLVYGPNAPGNFNTLLRWVLKGVPLPFGLIKNRRSFIALDNLTDFIIHCLNYKDTPLACGQVFLVSDGEDVSTSQFLRKVSKAVRSKTILLPIPTSILQLILRVIGKSNIAERLFDSLQVDNSKAKELLNWQPIITMDKQLKKIAKDL